MPMDFTSESDGDEMFLKSGHRYLFELTAEADSAADGEETQVHLRDGADASQTSIRLVSILFEKNQENIFVGQEIRNATQSRIIHQKN